MRRALPCEKCKGGATLKDGAGNSIVYAIGVQPSAFRTIGERFRYRCLGCGTAQEISKGAFYALPDLDAPPPVHEARESITEKQEVALLAKFTPKQRTVKAPKKAAKKKKGVVK